MRSENQHQESSKRRAKTEIFKNQEAKTFTATDMF